MRVFVTGATGAIGGHAVPALLRAGHEVSALARTPEKAAALTAQGAAAVSVSLFDRAALADAFAGHDAVANLASAIPPMSRFLSRKAWADCARVRTEGSAAVADAALAAGVGRMVQESVSMLYRDHGAHWIDEDHPIEHYPLARSNIAAERSAHRFTESGGVGVVLRFGWFYGPGAEHSEQLLAQARHHIAVRLGAADSYVSSIHMADAGRAVAAALDAPAGTYNVVDDEPLTKREYAAALADAAGTRAWIHGPGRAALLLGDRLTSLTRSIRVRNAKFREATGWAPEFPSAREGWRATAEGKTG
ncbi:NAD-dependent epimerase/dehydratase family protein [Amycolatopsis magusensis]|uniref:NAD-dependent epimerase/dehydratase family protein n=1 Tax=Amycolatopsis magusensis TaxID=882444 RepID=UPI0024A7C28C|nr:NAD(P)-dependent oxidoreductase [Amycolatopsis magusensis]MDI5981610.1 NAD(P)-dependent oxidoreductase [Amycolatopsis magusensis]